MAKIETRLQALEAQAPRTQRIYVLWSEADRQRAAAEATDDDIVINVEWCDVWPPGSENVRDTYSEDATDTFGGLGAQDADGAAAFLRDTDA